METKGKKKKCSIGARKMELYNGKGKQSDESRRKLIDNLANELQPTQESLTYYKFKTIEHIQEFDKVLAKIQGFQEDYKRSTTMEQKLHMQIEEIAVLKQMWRTKEMLLLRTKAEIAETETKNCAVKVQLKLCEVLVDGSTCDSHVDNQILFMTKHEPVVPWPGGIHRKPKKSWSTKTTLKSEEEHYRNKGNSKENKDYIDSLYKFACSSYEDYMFGLRRYCEDIECEIIDQQNIVDNVIKILDSRTLHTENQITEISKEVDKVTEEFSSKQALWDCKKRSLMDIISKLQTSVTNERILADGSTIYGGGSSIQAVQCEEITEKHEELEKEVNIYKDRYESLREVTNRTKEEAEKYQVLLEKKLKNLRSEMGRQMKNYKELERRQRLEFEGFLNEIRILQNLLKTVERKAVSQYVRNHNTSIKNISDHVTYSNF